MYECKVVIDNWEDIRKFCKEIRKIPEFQKLTEDEQLHIIFSYPFKYKIVNC